MPRAPSFGRLALASSLVLGLLGASSCALFGKALSKPPTLESRAWQVETVLVETPSGALGRPSVFVDGQGRPAVALADQGLYLGQSAVALARRDAEGWRVAFPSAPATWRVCGRIEGEAAVLSVGDLEGPLTGLRWTGTAAEPAEAGECPRPGGNTWTQQADDGAHRLELTGDGRTLLYDAPGGRPCEPHDSSPGQVITKVAFALDPQGHPEVAVFERAEDATQGQLRHARCSDGAWLSSVVAEGVAVEEVGLAVDPGGRPHVAFVVKSASSLELRHATPAEGAPAAAVSRDARVPPAVEACERIVPTPPEGQDVEAYRRGDAFRCAVLERDPVSSQEAVVLATARCEEGNARACMVAGSLHHWLMGVVSVEVELGETRRLLSEWRGLRPTGGSEDRGAAAGLYQRGCEGGEPRACLAWAALLSLGDETRSAPEDTACAAGLAAACGMMLASRPVDAALLSRVEPSLRTACEAGDRTACTNLGVARHLGGDTEQARVALAKACEAGSSTACKNASAL